MLIPVGIQQRCVKVERQFMFIDRWELEVLLIYWGFYSMTPTTPSPKKAFRTNFFPHSLLFILPFLIVHCKEVVPLQLNLIYFVLCFLSKDAQGRKNANCTESVCCWPEMVFCCLSLFSHVPGHPQVYEYDVNLQILSN